MLFIAKFSVWRWEIYRISNSVFLSLYNFLIHQTIQHLQQKIIGTKKIQLIGELFRTFFSKKYCISLKL